MPVLSKEDNLYHIGLWVKDGAVGIGTISFYNISNNKYAALGHGITDLDTGKLIQASKGEILEAQIISIEKGKNANPGQIKGSFVEDNIFGDIRKNDNTGIYGYYDTVKSLEKYKEGIEVANNKEVKTGQASILSTVNNEIKEYKVNIKKVYKPGAKDNKNMVVEVVDKELLNETGGIVQGMSGSPIIQNNKLIGILTHVYVNDPTQGYGIFAQTMLEEINSME